MSRDLPKVHNIIFDRFLIISYLFYIQSLLPPIKCKKFHISQFFGDVIYNVSRLNIHINNKKKRGKNRKQNKRLIIN